MQAGIARTGLVELTSKRRVRCLEQDLDIAALHHRGDVSGAGELAAVFLDRDRCREEARARERPACGACVGDEMADVVEEYLLSHGQLATRLLIDGKSGHGRICYITALWGCSDS